jgi:hypothetical protein
VSHTLDGLKLRAKIAEMIDSSNNAPVDDSEVGYRAALSALDTDIVIGRFDIAATQGDAVGKPKCVCGHKRHAGRCRVMTTSAREIENDPVECGHKRYYPSKPRPKRRKK